MKQWLKSRSVLQKLPRAHDTNSDEVSGDYLGIIAKLDYIKELGYSALWINLL